MSHHLITNIIIQYKIVSGYGHLYLMPLSIFIYVYFQWNFIIQWYTVSDYCLTAKMSQIKAELHDINWNIVESGVKHHNPILTSWREQ